RSWSDRAEFKRLRRRSRRPLAVVSVARFARTQIGVLVSAVPNDSEHDIFLWEILVGTGRFELPTPRTPSECSTRLSHVPTRRKLRAMARNRGNHNFTPEL